MLVMMVLASTVAVLHPGPNTFAQGEGYAGRTITGTVYFIAGRRPGRSLPFTLIINRLTTNEEVSQLNSALQAGKQDELLRSLSRLDAGRIQIGATVGVPANAIMVSDQETAARKSRSFINETCALPSCVLARARSTTHSATRRCTSAAEKMKAC